MVIFRKIYDWVLHWADTPFGPIALFIIAFAEASFFPIPPDVLLIALALGVRKYSFRFAFICTIASIMGAIAGYSIGHFIWWNNDNNFSSIAYFFFNHIPGFTELLFYKIKNLFEAWNFWIIFTAGFTPIPYKVFTISAGAFNINFFLFILASIVSRSARFFLVAGLIWKFGDSIQNFIDKYFNLLAILLTILIIAGFVVIKYLI